MSRIYNLETKPLNSQEKYCLLNYKINNMTKNDKAKETIRATRKSQGNPYLEKDFINFINKNLK